MKKTENIGNKQVTKMVIRMLQQRKKVIFHPLKIEKTKGKTEYENSTAEHNYPEKVEY